MPSCAFYAAGADIDVVLGFVFAHGDCDVYDDHYLDRPVAQLRSASEVRAQYGISSWEDLHEHAKVLIHPHDARGRIVFERIEGEGFACDYTKGWGLIALWLEPVLARRTGLRLSPCFTTHGSEKGASKWEPISPELGPPGAWDWPAVKRWSGRFNRFIRKQAVDRAHGRVVLPEAKRLADDGVELRVN